MNPEREFGKLLKALPEGVLGELLRHGDDAVWAAIAAHASTLPEDVIETLATSHNEAVQGNLARQAADLPEGALYMLLATTRTEEIRSLVFQARHQLRTDIRHFLEETENLPASA